MTSDKFELALLEAESAVQFGAWLRSPYTLKTWWSPGLYRLLGLHTSIPASHRLLLKAMHPDDRSFEIRMSASDAQSGHLRQVRIRHADSTDRLFSRFVREISRPGHSASNQLGLLFDPDMDLINSPFGRRLLSRLGLDLLPEGAPMRAADATSATSLRAPDPLPSDLVRAASGMLGWTMQDLAEASKLSYSTIRRVEEPEGRGPSLQTLLTVRRTFETHGLRFIRQGASLGLIRVSKEQSEPMVEPAA